MSAPFFVLEGLDGSGTTTQLRLASEAWPGLRCTAQPSDGPIGRLIRSVLRGESQAGAATLPYLFAADRRDHLDRVILRDLEAGAPVLCDRYVGSSLAYQGLHHPLDWIGSLNDRFPMPDSLVYLELDVEVALERIAQRGAATGQQREIYEAQETLRAVAGRYEEAIQWLEARSWPVTRLRADRPPQEVHADLRAIWEAWWPS